MSQSSEKAALRRRLRSTLRSMPPDEVRRRSAAACANVIASEEYQQAEIVMLFFSLSTEVDTTAIVLDCWMHDKRVVAPQVSYEIRRMIPVEINSFGELEADDRGVRQPVGGTLIPPTLIDLVLVPGLGFDRKGQRIGRGGGFYDRFLHNPAMKAVTCGLAFEDQFVDDVPTDHLDQSVQMLITDAHVRRFAGSPAENDADGR